MSFDGNRASCSNSTERDRLQPRGHAKNPRQKLQRAFALFQKRRKNNQVLATPGEPAAMNVCECGQHKNLSARYCIACADARHILKQKFIACEHSGHYREERERTVYALPNKRVPDKIGAALGGDDNLDRLVNLYEQELTNYG